MRILHVLLAAGALAVIPAVANAACDVKLKGEVDVITNSFPALDLLAKKMKECASGDLKVDVKESTEHRAEVASAFGAGKSPYDAAHVANSSITPLQAKGELMPLNDLVAKYKDKYKLEDQMLIKFGDNVMAVAFMANAQILFYRQDLFDKLGLKAPTTYDEVLAACEKLKGESSIQFPYGAAFKTGWELGNEFVNIFLASGGNLVDPATSEAGFNNEKGLATLELMHKLMGYMSPNALDIDFNGVKQQLQQGQIGMAFLWGDTAASMDKADESKVVGKMAFAPAPAAVAGGPAATTFWWDGYVIPKNLDGDADATFQVIMEALKPDVVTENNDTALWLRSNYKPTKYAMPITQSVQMKAPPYPMTPVAGMAHGAIGDHIADFLAGKVSAQQALDDAAKAYRKAAVEAGLLK